MKVLLGFLMLFVMAGTAFASDTDDVNAATETLRKAMLKGNKAALEASIMPDLIYVHSAGKVENAAQFVGAIAGESKVDTYKAIAFNNQSVATDGNLAIVSHIFDGTCVSKGKNDDKTYTVHIGVTQLWKKYEGKWKLQARKAVLLPF
jgi:ketosteroid isomerase-like protein